LGPLSLFILSPFAGCFVCLLGWIISTSLSVFPPQNRNIKVKKEKKGEWGTILATVPFPKASSFLVGACSSYLQTNNKIKFKIKKRGNGRRKVVRVLSHVGASGMVGQKFG
jgi:hypothetical protein